VFNQLKVGAASGPAIVLITSVLRSDMMTDSRREGSDQSIIRPHIISVARAGEYMFPLSRFKSKVVCHTMSDIHTSE